MINVVNLSGGKDSTAMLLLMRERDIRIDEIIFVDMGKEFPQMYAHIEKLQEYISPLKITTININYDYFFGEHIKTRGRVGEVGYGWPNYLNRWCTTLKTNAIRKHIKIKFGSEIAVVKHIGLASDEKHRVKPNKPNETLRYPLIEWGFSEKQALDYCYSKGFDWGGLYDKFARLSCWCCPLSRIGEMRVLYNDFPRLWKKLEDMDTKTFRRFTPSYTVEELSRRFLSEK